jgi:hypothetical protein
MATALWKRVDLLASFLDSRSSTPESCDWAPRRVGPRFDWLDHDSIRIIDGTLSERRFGINTELRTKTATVFLREGSQSVGQLEIERDREGKGITLRNVAVRQQLRGGGLATIMTWCAFRELLAVQDSATFRIRMVHPTKPGNSGTEVQSIGMGVIAARLGFRPELPIEKILQDNNITGVDALPGENGNPPALKIAVRDLPMVIVASALNPDTMKPIADVSTYLQLKVDHRPIQNWSRDGLLLVNGDYCLREPEVARFADLLATDPKEARTFRAKVQGL